MGGGLAGLSAGVALAEAGYQVELLERRAFLGGRAYSFLDNTSGDVVDNGQHLMMGCYQETFRFFKRLGTLDKLKFQPQPRVDFLDAQLGQTTFQCPSLPAPLHLLVGMFRLKGLSLGDKLRLLKIGPALQTKSEQILARFGHLTVDQWLSACGQSPRIKERFWEPFAIATLNEDTKIAVASLLIKVLQQAFGGSKDDSTMVVSAVGLSELYTEQAQNFIESRGGKVHLRAIAEEIQVVQGRCAGVRLKDGTIKQADIYISALPYHALQPLWPQSLTASDNSAANWQQLSSAPIVSINLWFDRPVTEVGFAGLLGTQVQWLFNKDMIFARSRQDCQQLSLVISAAHPFMRLSKEQIVEIALTDLAKLLPKTKEAKLLRSLVIKEQHATFSATIAAEKVRPSHRTAISNLLLAGDWTNTGLPATIEGAVLSGHRCAELAQTL